MKVLFIVPFHFIGTCNSAHPHLFIVCSFRSPLFQVVKGCHGILLTCSTCATLYSGAAVWIEWLCTFDSKSMLSCSPEILLVPQWPQSEASATSNVAETHPPLNSMGWWLLQSRVLKSSPFAAPYYSTALVWMLVVHCLMVMMLMMWCFW